MFIFHGIYTTITSHSYFMGYTVQIILQELDFHVFQKQCSNFTVLDFVLAQGDSIISPNLANSSGQADLAILLPIELLCHAIYWHKKGLQFERMVLQAHQSLSTLRKNKIGLLQFDTISTGPLLPRLGGAFDLRLAVSVPLPIVMGIFMLLWFQSRLT